MISWRNYPFLRILIPFTGGILLQSQLPLLPAAAWLLLVISFAGLVLTLYLAPSILFRVKPLPATSFFICFLSLGIIAYRFHAPVKNTAVNTSGSQNQKWTGTINSVAEKRKNSTRVYATLEGFFNKRAFYPDKRIIIIYFRKEAERIPMIGEKIIFSKNLDDISRSGNPGDFDFRRWALIKGMRNQVFLGEEEYCILPGKPSFLQKWLTNSRSGILTILRKNITNSKACGLAEALLIGYKNDVDPELTKSYSRTGVTHIIAISGMHLGLVYWILDMLFRPFKKKKKRWLPALIIICGLWLFSLLAGAQASILRSALMFTFLLLGETFDRRHNSINSLAASAFFLLLLNPVFLWDIGFQLSYAAVLSIIIFQRPVYNLVIVKNKIFDAIWKLNAVTLAAQILTVPLTIYYFHRFPVYFMLSNIVAVPLSSLLIVLELILCGIAYLPVIASFTGKLILLMIQVMNGWIEWVAFLPGGSWEGMQINLLQVLLLFVLIVLITSWIRKKSVRSFKLGLFVLLIFVLCRSISFIECGSQQKLIVYNSGKNLAMDFLSGRNCRYIGDSTVNQETLNNSRSFFRVYAFNKPYQISETKILVTCGKKIMVLRDNKKYAPSPALSTVDVLVVAATKSISIADLTRQYVIKKIVLTTATSIYSRKKIKDDCLRLRIPFYDCAENGAFVMNLR